MRRPLSLQAMLALAGAALLPSVQPARAVEAETSDDRSWPASGGALALKIEPGIALPLTHPQSRQFNPGGGEAIKVLWSVSEHLDLGPSAAFLALPSAASGDQAGVAWTFGGSLRYRPLRHVPERPLGLSPWVDADVLYVRTGGLDRPGFAAAAGVSVPIGKTRAFWVGPFVRYFQILERKQAGFDDSDAKLLSLGVSLEVGPGREREPSGVAAEIRTVNNETFFCPDRDRDGVLDSMDHCPDAAGPMDTWGCPPYKKLIVQQDRLELKEKLYFAWDQAVLQEVSFPVLDEVVQALNDNKGFRVQVEGHASSDGGDDHNQTLSEQRATEVLNYLVSHGIDKGRLASKGFGSSVPLDTNETIAGRENNRRVEFVVYFTILSEETN